MKEIALLLRALKLYAHQAHNLCGRVAFHQDHEFFAEVYEAAENDYDGVVERIIGLFGEEKAPTLAEEMSFIGQKVSNLPQMGVKENSAFYQVILQLEMEICAKIAAYCKSGQCSPGTEQLLGDVCNRLETEQYKIKQRLKK